MNKKGGGGGGGTARWSSVYVARRFDLVTSSFQIKRLPLYELLYMTYCFSNKL